MTTAPPNSVWKQVDHILWEVWDPIGVNDMPENSDEYRDYVPLIYDALIRGASDDAIEQILRTIEVQQMGLSNANDVARQATVAALRTIELPGRER